MVVCEADVRVFGEAQDLGFVGLETLPEVVGIGFGDAAALPFYARRDFGQFPFRLGEDGSVSSSQGLVLPGGEGPVVALCDLVAGFEEQVPHAPGPVVAVRLDDEGEFLTWPRSWPARDLHCLFATPRHGFVDCPSDAFGGGLDVAVAGMGVA